MKKTILLALVLPLLFIVSCSREPCYSESFGYITVSNTSTNPYDIWINNQYQGSLGGNRFVEFEVGEGDTQLFAQQRSGYAFWPTERSHTFYLDACEEVLWSIP